ncbi:MAG: hypothetical protein GX907_02305 [Clostridiaceae bacterium]|nr:hypothetical protein [Clostridiaceae bacterium]
MTTKRPYSLLRLWRGLLREAAILLRLTIPLNLVPFVIYLSEVLPAIELRLPSANTFLYTYLLTLAIILTAGIVGRILGAIFTKIRNSGTFGKIVAGLLRILCFATLFAVGATIIITSIIPLLTTGAADLFPWLDGISLWFRIFAIFIIILSFHIGLNRIDDYYIQIFTDHDIRLAIGAAILSVLTLAGVRRYEGLTYVTFVILLQFAGWALLRNQGSIDLAMERGKHRPDHLPQHIRRYNAIIVGGLSLSLVSIFLLRNQLIAGFEWLLNTLKSAIRAVYNWLANLFSSDETVVPEPTQPMPPNGGGPGMLPPAKPTPRWLQIIQEIFYYLVLALAVVIIAYLLYILLRKTFRRLHQFFAAVFNRETAPATFVAPEQGYEDEFIQLDPGLRDSPTADLGSKRNRWRRWRAQVRAWRADNLSLPEEESTAPTSDVTTTNHNLQIRRGYWLIQRWFVLQQRDDNLTASPAAFLEQLRNPKSATDLDFMRTTYNANPDHWEQIVRGYMAERYGQSTDVASVQMTLSAIEAVIDNLPHRP